MARPSLLEKDPGITERICERVRQGVDPAVAARIEGIGTSTYYQWMGRGESEPESVPYGPFAESVARAVAEAEASLVAQLRNLPMDDRGKADNAQARAIMFLLERSRAERYGAKVEVKQKAEETLREGLLRLRPLVSEAAWREILEGLAKLGSE